VSTPAIQSNPLKQFWPARSYQKDAVKLLITMGCGGLLLDPGLGKTAIALCAFNILKNKGINKRLLVITPLRAMAATWPAELRKWQDFSGLRFAVLHGPDKEEMLDVDADVFLINPDATQWLNEEGRWRRIKADILCVDESTKFKNSSTKRFKALRLMLPTFMRRWILTGTPTPNGLLDLFGQIYILDLGNALGRFITHYRQTYFFPSGYGGYEWRPKLDTAEKIAKQIDPLVLRLKAEDWVDMPELIYHDIVVELPPAARKTYREIEDQFITELQTEKIVAANAAVAGGKCRQIANGAIYSERDALGTGKRTFHKVHDSKLEALRDLLEELQGQPLLILYEFNHDRDIIQEDMPWIPDLGSVSLKKSVELIDAFNKGLLPALLGHPAGMGHGLNMQEVCSRVAWYGLTWNFEHYDQALRRVWRSGQKALHVMVYRIVAKDTLDETVIEALKFKDKVQTTFTGMLRTFKRK
jgi:SNF2 family DNA or RNA helicase